MQLTYLADHVDRQERESCECRDVESDVLVCATLRLLVGGRLVLLRAGILRVASSRRDVVRAGMGLVCCRAQTGSKQPRRITMKSHEHHLEILS